MESREIHRPAHPRYASEPGRTKGTATPKARIPDREEEMLALYSVERLCYREATEEEVALAEAFFKCSDEKRQRDILFQLVPETTDAYVEAYLSGEPYPPERVIDKLMDEKDPSTRRKIIAEAGMEVSDKILSSILYLPLTDDEKRWVSRFGSVGHHPSPYRNDDYAQTWSDMTEKEKTVIKIMDADHRLTFAIASRIVDAYEKRIMEKEPEKKPPKSSQSSLDEAHIFWLDYGIDSRYLKRQAYAELKLANQEITDEALHQVAANRFLNHVRLALTPIWYPLLSWETTCRYERILAENLP